MTLLSQQISGYMENASWIRRMFETGNQLKQQFGEDAVCDFSLGNPDLPAPPAVAQGMRALADKADQPFAFGYMPNAGYPWARKQLAAHLTTEQHMPPDLPIDADHVILTCGAAGALNIFFRTVLNEGDEVLSFAPYFVEYGFYVQNHRGIFHTVPTMPDTFAPDLTALEHAIGPKTKALMINSPNNPTGTVYSRAQLQGIVEVLTRLSTQYGHPIWLIADEPYRFLAFDGVEVPSVLPLYPYAVVVSSFSKNLSLAGERLGYCILSPHLPE
ncbi:MAG: pyridoxal phosphate-dependent aminotransferase, partial [Desulfovibrionaceae bacterium]